jgi:hypothetical protein
MENHGGMISTGETPDSSTQSSDNPSSNHIVAKQDEVAKEMINLVYEIFISYFEDYVTDDFISFPNVGMLQIFIALKNASLSARFEPMNPWSNCKHANQYTRSRVAQAV